MKNKPISEYDPKKIEKKWQKEWQKKKIYKTTDPSQSSNQKKFYVLDMFPYPSGEGLHVGHPKGYIATDVVSRLKRMQGFNVLHPMGFDAFGLPAEQYAIKMKVNPAIAVAKNVAHYKKQLEILGFDYDWSREVVTTDPKFYKWTQWIFLKLLEKGLAYEAYQPINWCPVDKTGLANEDVEDGRCERCGALVEKKMMKQWILKITDYAERLLNDLDRKDGNGRLLLNWPESIKESQRNWIGKSEGMLFTSPVKDSDMVLKTFSAHFEAFAADTFIVIAPDHPLLEELIKGVPNKKEIIAFSQALISKRNKEGYKADKEPEGIFTGRYALDPVGNGELPIWIANYALSDYGTGMVKCSAHDERDFMFAKKYNISLKPVLFPEDPEERKKVEDLQYAYTDMQDGILSLPYEFKGKRAGHIRNDIQRYLERNKLAERNITYKLRDWVFSRQRYWGEPIPVFHDPSGKSIPVLEKELPVKLPKVKFYEPTGTGESPLADIPQWVNVKKGKTILKRETNTMPQWAGSSWYYLRYMDPKNNKQLVDPKKEKYWGEIDLYVGGAEHAARHLIYARFWHKFLYDIGVVSTEEPFYRFKNVGIVMAEDGRKMSKRWGNVINPDDIVKNYGADTLRLYEMFMGPFDQAISWNTNSMIGSRRFIERVWKMKEKVVDHRMQKDDTRMNKKDLHNKKVDGTLETHLQKTIKKVGDDIVEMRFNTAVSSLMILSNELDKQSVISKEHYQIFIGLLAPFIPHVAEELWKEMGNKRSIHLEKWPEYDETMLQSPTSRVAIQVNGKTRGSMIAQSDELEESILNKAKELPEVKKWLETKVIKNVIYVKGRIVNIVIDEL